VYSGGALKGYNFLFNKESPKIFYYRHASVFKAFRVILNAAPKQHLPP